MTVYFMNWVLFLYHCAVTEFEIHDGLVKSKTPSRHVICFLRRFSDLTDDVIAAEKDPSRYIDIERHDGKVIKHENSKKNNNYNQFLRNNNTYTKM